MPAVPGPLKPLAFHFPLEQIKGIIEPGGECFAIGLFSFVWVEFREHSP